MQFVRNFILVVTAWFIALGSSFAAPPEHAAKPEQRGMPAHLRAAFAERHKPERQARLMRAIEAQERHSEALLADPDILGTGISWDKSGAAIIKLFIKGTGSQAGLPGTIDGLPVVIETINGVYAQNVGCEQRGTCEPEVAASSATEPGTPRERHDRPVPIGVSLSLGYGTSAGTLGCRVADGCHKYVLSNAHVLRGPNGNANVGSKIIQPGTLDGGLNINFGDDDVIADLFDYVDIIELAFPIRTNRVDAAIAKAEAPTVGTATRSDGYGEPMTETTPAFVGLEVMKYGRTTGYTEGYVSDINVLIDVEYAGPMIARFSGQMIIRPSGAGNFSLAGDSGSLILARGGANDRKAVGLLFASGTDGQGNSFTAANPIDEVLAAFGVTIEGEVSP